MENNNNGKGNIGNGKEVRKGAWTSEEDILLRDCIHKFGEGNWHLVPLRAGLNRCRKSCRLRCLNYLRPNLKRGYFEEDEVDLITRLHKLLGNRWSLIAGRLPGRTANDVKNFWNTHMNPKKLDSPSSMVERITHTNILRPQPRPFSTLQLLPLPACSNSAIKHDPTNTQLPSSSSLKEDENITASDSDESIRWWGNLLHMSENQQTPFLFPNHYPPITDSTSLPGIPDHGINPHDPFSFGGDHYSQLEHYLFKSD